MEYELYCDPDFRDGSMIHDRYPNDINIAHRICGILRGRRLSKEAYYIIKREIEHCVMSDFHNRDRILSFDMEFEDKLEKRDFIEKGDMEL